MMYSDLAEQELKSFALELYELRQDVKALTKRVQELEGSVERRGFRGMPVLTGEQ